LRDREGDISKGVPITAKSTKLTFDDAVKDVIADYTVDAKKSTEEIKRRVKLHLTPAFGGRKLSALTTADFRAFAARRLEAKAAAAEINRELAIVRRAFRLAVEADKYHGRVPKFPVPQERNVRSGFFDDEMIEAVKARLPEALRPVGDVRLYHRLAGVVRGAPAGVAVGRSAAAGSPSGPRHDEESGGPGVFPFTDTLHTLTEALWVEHKALEKAARSAATSSIGTAGASRHFGAHGRRPVSRRGIRGAFSMTSAGPRCGTWSEPACLGPWPCS
jgi:hypothetical protein